MVKRGAGGSQSFLRVFAPNSWPLSSKLIGMFMILM